MKNRYKILFTTLALLVCAFVGFSQSENIKIFTDNDVEQNYLEADDFYLTHYLYIDLFLRESLFADAKEEDVIKVLEAIKKHASVDSPLDFEIGLDDERTYKLRIRIVRKDGEELFIAFTNFNPETRQFEEEFGQKSYTRWYFLNGEKMTYRKDLSKENDYAKMSPGDLANAYLLDELKENDKEIESIFSDINDRGQNENIQEKLVEDLVLLKYHIYKDEEKEASELMGQIGKSIKQYKLSVDLRGIESAYKATEFQINLMRLLKEI